MRREIENNVWALIVRGYSSATDALERERWGFFQMGQAPGWGRLHSSLFESRKNKNE